MKRRVMGFPAGRGRPARAASVLCVAVATCLSMPSLAPVFAEEVALTVDEAVARARHMAPALAALLADEEAAAAARRAAQSERIPRLDLSAGYTRYSHVPELAVPLGGTTRVLFPDIPDLYRGRALVSSPLYTFGRLGASIAAAREEERAAGETREAGLADVVLETRRAFWDLLVARERRRVLDEALASFDAHAKDAANREKAGLAARNEVLAIEVERDRAELARIEADRAAAVAEASLRTWLDYPAGTTIRTLGTPEADAAPTFSAPGAAPQGVDAGAIMSRRPEHLALDARRRAMLERSRAATRSRLPQLSLAAGYDYARPNRRITPPVDRWKESWDVSLNLAWSPWDGGRARADAARARAQAASLAGSLRELERGMEIEVTSAALELETARRSLEVAERALASARENLEVAEDRYREGMIPSSERLDAESALLRAGLDRTGALARLELARAGWERATTVSSSAIAPAAAGPAGAAR